MSSGNNNLGRIRVRRKRFAQSKGSLGGPLQRWRALKLLANPEAILGLAVVAVLIFLDWYRRSPQRRSNADHLMSSVLTANPWFASLWFWITVAAILATLAIWKLPVWQVARSTGLKSTTRFERENEARKTLAQIVAGVIVLAGLYSSVETFDLSRQGQITDRFTKAIEQLGAQDAHEQPKIEVRLGGIYALERIARDSQRDHPVIMEVLTAYVRKNLPRSDSERQVEDRMGISRSDEKKIPQAAGANPREDIRAVLTVLGRRVQKYDSRPPDLTYVDLSGADHGGIDLSGADLRRADLSGAKGLSQSQIESAYGNKDTNLPPGLKILANWLK